MGIVNRLEADAASSDEHPPLKRLETSPKYLHIQLNGPKQHQVTFLMHLNSEASRTSAF